MKIALDVLRACSPGAGKAGYYWYIYYIVSNLLKADSKNEYVLFANFIKGKHLETTREFFSLFPDASFRERISRIPPQVWRSLGLPIELAVGPVDVFHGMVDYVPPTRSAKRIVTLHDLAYRRIPHLLKKEWIQANEKITTASTKRAHHIIAVSEFTKREASAHLNLPPDKITVIHHGVDPLYRQLDNEELIAKALASYSVKKPYLLYIGTFWPHKNIDRLIEAYYRLRKQESIPHQLVLVGAKGWRFEGTFNRIHELGLEKVITCTGPVPQEDMPLLYAGADAFVFPSLHEGFGMPVLEAMASGVPVLTSNVCSLPEIADGAALLVDPTEVEQIAEGIFKIISDRSFADRLRESGKKRAAEFTWEKAAMATLGVYQKVCSSA
ncbi:MAG: glycosyltransferase family 1 protein [Candidatus Abyssobacteria bacterium SURF_5]|uniref:Glycosyltransferase family 1 protein n=1 Tax=Abyssobacteria bacterium (strain SURF_5) TaxID=2093360 RepID=A0A3A4NYB5_ABYX5|nr:MAG: glycosyltransferase family 1 protein [Candidatus Abyssubacteria bacterium SURF_5]